MGAGAFTRGRRGGGGGWGAHDVRSRTVKPPPPSCSPSCPPTGLDEPERLAAWVAGMAAGDVDALARFHEATFDRVYATAMRVLRNAADAEEVASEALQQAWDRAALYDPARGAVLGWLLNLAWSRAVDRLRRTRRRREQTLHPADGPSAYTPHEDDTAPALLDQLDARARVARALAGLSPEQQRMVELAFVADLSHSEIAERTGVPLGTVKSHLRRALQALRRHIQPEDDDGQA